MKKDSPFPSSILQIIAVIIASSLITAIILVFIPIEELIISKDAYENMWLSNSIIVYIVLVLIIVITCIINAITKKNVFVINNSFKGKWGSLLLILMLIVLSHYLLIVPLESIISNGVIYESPVPSISFVLTTVLFFPVLEEIVFRGIFLSGLLCKYPKTYAVIISSLLFGLLHFDYHVFFGAFVVGVLLSILYIKTDRNIVMCVICHMCVNLLPLTRCYQLQIYKNLVFDGLLFSISLIIICFCYLWIRKYKHLQSIESNRQKKLNLISIRTYSNRYSAEIEKSLLESNGVICILDGEVSYYPDFNAIYPIHLKVREEDAPLAINILEAGRTSSK